MTYYARYVTGGKDTKWYICWAREWPSGWSVDRLYLPATIAELRDGCRFWELPWSSCKEDGLTEDGAMAIMNKIHATRSAHGYTLTESGAARYENGHYVDWREWTPDEKDN